MGVNLFQGLSSFVAQSLTFLPGILIAITVHEFAHGFVAFQMGDPTAKRAGRLSLNPIVHIDPVGFIFLLLFRFGWAKPVPINQNYFRNKKLGLFLTSIAGIVANVILAWLLFFIFKHIPLVQSSNILNGIFYYAIMINLTLAAFNLIPIPPLDGSKIVYTLFPSSVQSFFFKYEKYGMILLFILLYTGGIQFIFNPLLTFVLAIFSKIS